MVEILVVIEGIIILLFFKFIFGGKVDEIGERLFEEFYIILYFSYD